MSAGETAWLRVIAAGHDRFLPGVKLQPLLEAGTGDAGQGNEKDQEQH
jgi:hypothetical protein